MARSDSKWMPSVDDVRGALERLAEKPRTTDSLQEVIADLRARNKGERDEIEDRLIVLRDHLISEMRGSNLGGDCRYSVLSRVAGGDED